MAVSDWSTTPATNATAPGITWAEGQFPQTVNDSARQMMADIKSWYDSNATALTGKLDTTAGAVGTTNLANAAVTTAKTADGFLSADTTGRAKMADGFLSADTTGRAKMADGFLTSPKLALGAWTNVASAATVDLGAQTSLNIVFTGTTGITSLGTTATAHGAVYRTRFAGALTLTNSATLILIGGANITTAAGDIAGWVWEGSNVWRMVSYERADGTALVPLAATVAPRPQTAAGIGQWVQNNSSIGAALVLPAGGTWGYFAFRIINASGAVTGSAVGVGAGGSTVGAAVGGDNWIGFAWRIA